MRLPISVVCAVVVSSSASAEIVGEMVSTGIARYFADANAQTNALPSLALQQGFNGMGPVPPGALIEPEFETLRAGQVRASIDVADGSSLYGTGMVPGTLIRNGRRTVCWNSDSFAWNDGTESLYQSHPWVFGVRPDGTCFGILADTSYRCEIDLTNALPGAAVPEIVFTADGPEFPVYVIEGATPEEVMQRLATLIGTMPLPPIWSLGFHQCRYQYAPAQEMLNVAQEFRNRNLPCDVIWGDIEYMDGFRLFTFDPFEWPNPAQLDSDLEAINFKTIYTLNQGVKIQNGYAPYDEAEQLDLWVKEGNGTSDFFGEIWAGSSKFIDFTMQDARDWWADQVAAAFGPVGVDGMWNDMNEPTSFNTPNRSIGLDDIHRADAIFGGTQTHDRWHNAYGMQMARASWHGMLQANPGKRPFVLTRASYIGGQRYAAAWTGDNNADEYNVRVSIPMVLNLGLSGQPFSGPDIGGFNGSLSGDLFARWMGIGTMLPFARNHTGSFQRKEPWEFGTAVEETSRRALNRRYRLLPHFYTLFYESSRNGMPPARPLFFADTSDPDLRDVDDTFLLGDALIVSAAEVGTFACDGGPAFPPPPGGIYEFAFPESNSPGAASDETDEDLPKLYLRGGHIIPTQPIVQYTTDGEPDELILIVALDENGEARGALYEDEGDGFDYLTGEYLLTTYVAQEIGGGQVEVSVESTMGSRSRPANRPVTVRLLQSDGTEIIGTGIDGQTMTLQIPAALQARAIDPFARRIDGCLIPDAFEQRSLLATQDTPTAWGNNFNELNQLFLDWDPDGLRVGVSGNITGDGNALMFLVDAGTGGQPVMDTSNAPVPPAGVGPLTGMIFDAGFTPETMFWINTFNGEMFVDQFQLFDEGGTSKTYRGSTGVDVGSGGLGGGFNPNGIEVAFSNANRLGVNSISAVNASTSLSGFEMLLPFEELGITEGACFRARFAVVIIAPSGEVSAQWLPGVGGAGPSLGFSPDLGAVPGTQFVEFVNSVGDINGDGSTTLPDFAVLANNFGSGPGATRAHGDLTGDGFVTLEDFTLLASNFGCLP
ncbi:MAG: TIM-barrel domain-containing protein [Planctomycetota bacterium]